MAGIDGDIKHLHKHKKNATCKLIFVAMQLISPNSYINSIFNIWTAGAKNKNSLTDINYDVLNIN